MIVALCVVAFIVLLVVVIRRAATRAERAAKERANRKFASAMNGDLETLLTPKPDTRKVWAGEDGGES